MATDTLITEDTGTVVQRDLTRWPVYDTKALLLRDIMAATTDAARMDIAMRLSNTDTSGSFVDDKASRIN